MREITKSMIKDFKIYQLGYDFMGYRLQKNDIYTFHHLIVPNRLNGPYERWNGAILCGKTSHPYLHLIEAKDLDMFNYITSEIVDMNIKGYLDIDNLKKINDLLNRFEKENYSVKTKKGKLLIKEEYTIRILKQNN
ncbi:MAG: hypothetical protein V8Q75_06420 [Bacilli bacterium]